MDNPPRVPTITGAVQKQPRRESLTDVFTSAATAVANAFSSTRTAETPLSQQVKCSPSKTVDIRIKNLEQLRVLQGLCEDGILTEDEFLSPKRIVLQSLSNLL